MSRLGTVLICTRSYCGRFCVPSLSNGWQLMRWTINRVSREIEDGVFRFFRIKRSITRVSNESPDLVSLLFDLFQILALKCQRPLLLLSLSRRFAFWLWGSSRYRFNFILLPECNFLGTPHTPFSLYADGHLFSLRLHLPMENGSLCWGCRLREFGVCS